MNNSNTKLNPDQQQALELLEKNCKKVELFDIKGDLNLLPDTFLCLLEDQKIIEVTFSSVDDTVSVMYWDHREYAECEESMLTNELNEQFIERMFETVANDTQERLKHVRNQTYVQRIQEFLK